MNYEEIIQQIISAGPQTLTANDVKKMKREFSKKNGMDSEATNIALIKSYRQMIKEGKISQDFAIEKLLRKRAIRSESGIVAVQVLTKPYPCPGKCIFCPNDDTMPKSYIKTEPGAMRAGLNNFDPYKQTYNRLLSLSMTGHNTDKIEMIVLGGTFDFYPEDYKIAFIKGLYDACNTFEEYLSNVELSDTQKYVYSVGEDFNHKYPATVQESIQINETAKNRIIGLTIETRPEFVTDKNCIFWRDLGVTRIEMGVQSYFDDVLDANQRGHKIESVRKATHRLRQYGFKFCIHIMPGLYQSTYEKDLGTFQKIYSDISIKPDEIKFYPTSVIPNTKLYDLYKEGAYKPLETKEIIQLIKQTFLEIIPPYTRIKRLIRDIPSTEIAAGSNITNLSQMTQDGMRKHWRHDDKETKEQMETFYKRLYSDAILYSDIPSFLHGLQATGNEEKIGREDNTITTYILGQKPDSHSFRNFVCLDTRSREIRNRITPQLLAGQADSSAEEIVNLVVRKYASSVGQEYFISYEDTLGYLYGFTRLLLPKPENTVEIMGLGSQAAIIRELHVYGKLEKIDIKDKEMDGVQHRGFGGKLMQIAEQISQYFDYKKMSVISGVGVREYYRHLGYKIEGTYMTKTI